jgi:hypothetical protein
MSLNGQDEPVLLRDAFVCVKNFRYNETTLRGRGGLALIQEMLRSFWILTTNWGSLLEQEKPSIGEIISSDFVTEAIRLLCSASFRGFQPLQLSCIKDAANCAFVMLKIGYVDFFVNVFRFVYPMHDGKVHDSLIFFQNMDSIPIDEEAQLINVTVWDGYFVPMAVLSYMDSLMTEGLLDHIIREFESAHISSPRGSELLFLFGRLRLILTPFALGRVKECLLVALNGVLSSDGHELRKLDKNVLFTAFRTVVLAEKQLRVVSVNELGLICLSLLKSPLLDKRMMGSTCLNLLCEHAVLAKTDSYDKFEEIAISLRHFLISNGILDLLFGPSMHGEVSKLKRCCNIVKMMFNDFGSNAQLVEQATFVWNSMFDRHSEMFECCYDAYLQVIRFASVDVLGTCLRRMLSTSDDVLNARPRVLRLLADVLERPDPADAVTKKEFVDSISEFLLNLQLSHCDDPAFSELVMHAKFILFAPSLQDADAHVLFNRICEKCISDLQNPSSTSCKVLEFLLEFYSKHRVESCESQLLVILCHVFDALYSRCVLDACSVSMFTFLSHNVASQLIGPEQEEKLWRALAVDTVDEGRRQQAFEFILQSKSLSTNVQRSILETRLPQLPASCMTPKALECLLYLMKVVNTPDCRSQVGIKRDRSEVPDFTATSNVIGLDTLWKFCLSCPDANILQRAVAKFSSYIIDSGHVHPGIFKSVVDSCVAELRSVGTDFVKARNIISLMLDFSRSTNLMFNVFFADEKYQPLGRLVHQPDQLVLIFSDNMFHSTYCSPLMTIKQFRSEFVSKLNDSLSFEVLFQVMNSEGEVDFVSVDTDSDYLGHYGPVITCKLTTSASNQNSSRTARTHVNSTNLKSEKHQKYPRLQPPSQHGQVAASNSSGHPGQCLPLIRVAFDDNIAFSALGNENEERIGAECSPSRTEIAGHFNSRDFKNAQDGNILESSKFYMWSIFTENYANYHVLFELGSAFPFLNARIWELLLLLPVDADFISRIQRSLSQPRMFFDLPSTLEKMYFLSCVSVWKKLPSCCFDQQIDSDSFFSSVAVAALDTVEALQSSVSIATSHLDPSLDLQGAFAPLLLSYHLSSITAIRCATHSNPNFTCLP